MSGSRGSGAIFFGGCSLRCVFCQNYDVSQGSAFPQVTDEQLAGMMLTLQAHGWHNINFVTPSHVIPQILEALKIAASRGLKIPLVYNSSGYDRAETLRLLEGIVDIYLPDFKIWDPDMAKELLHARDYPEYARTSLKEMHRQVGILKEDTNGIARRGLLIRHLVMPNALSDTKAIVDFIANELSANTHVNIMGQYHPSGEVKRKTFSGINRRTTIQEFKEAQATAKNAGLNLE